MIGPKSRPDAKAFGDLLRTLRRYERKFRWQRGLRGDNEIAEGYSSVLDLLAVGLDCYVHNSPSRPHFVKLVSPIRKIGGDNADALYFFAPLESNARYQVTGTMGGAVYLGLTVYGGKTPERFHIVSNVATPEIKVEPDGTFAVEISPKPGRADKNVVETDATANCLIIRRYFLDKTHMHSDPGDQAIVPLDAPRPPPMLTAEQMGLRIQRLDHFLRGWFGIIPLPMPPIALAYNRMTKPRRASEDTGHWSTPDNIHSFGLYRLAAGQGLRIKGRSPDCLYWSVHLWNPYLQTYDYEHHRCTMNSSEVTLEDDGSWELLIAQQDPGHPNWISTAGHPRGFVYFRWLKSLTVPEKLNTKLLKL
jgi:hypothetical protein